MHEWEYKLLNHPKSYIDELGKLVLNGHEPLSNMVTWVFNPETFVPTAKITENGTYSIITDHLGTPTEAYNESGEKIWSCQLDIYGKIRKLEGDRSLIPFKYQGQYEDVETGLCYNRFRYYSPESGTYISQDPIGLAGNNPNIYAYVADVNSWVDPYGLNNVSTGAGRTHVKYSGIKDGKPYHGYASAPTSEGLKPDEIVSRRYGNNFDDFDIAPQVDYTGEGVEGKQTARGLEQRGFEADGGLDGTSNKQNPVGPNNKNRQNYLDTADNHNKSKIKGCG